MSNTENFDPTTGEVFEDEEKQARPRSKEVDFIHVTPREVIELVMYPPKPVDLKRDEDAIRQALVGEATIAGDEFYTTEASLGGPNLNVKAARAIHRNWGNSIIAITRSQLDGENFVYYGYYADFERRYISAESFTIPKLWHYNIRKQGKEKGESKFAPSLKEIDLLLKNSAQTGMGMLWRNLRTHNTPEHIKKAMLEAAKNALVKKLEGGIEKSGGWDKFVAGWVASIQELGIKRIWILRRFVLTDLKNIGRDDMATLIHEFKQIQSGAFSISEFWSSYEDDDGGGSSGGGRLEAMAAAIKQNSNPAPATEPSRATAPVDKAQPPAKSTATAPATSVVPAPDGADLSKFNPEHFFERSQAVEKLVAIRAELVARGTEFLERVMRLELTMKANPVNYAAMSYEDMKVLLQGFENIRNPKPEEPVGAPLPPAKNEVKPDRKAILIQRLLELRQAADFEDSGRVIQAEQTVGTNPSRYSELSEKTMKVLAQTFKEIAAPKAEAGKSASQRAATKDSVAREISLFVGAAGEDDSPAGEQLRGPIKTVFKRFPQVKYKDLLASDLSTLSALKAALLEIKSPFDEAGIHQ